MTSAPAKAQRSIRWCQSRPLRASLEASMQNTAPIDPLQTAATSRWNPGRSVMPEPDRPKSSSITKTEAKPAVRAASTSAYCRIWLSVLPSTWPIVDWRT